jgi:hypothetical protein
MRVQFSHSREFVPEWNFNRTLPHEEQLKYKLAPMELLDLLDLLDATQQAGIIIKADGTADIGAVNADRNDLLLRRTVKYLTKYVTPAGAPLIDADGIEIPFSDVPKYIALAGLGSELIGALVAGATPNVADIKN